MDIKTELEALRGACLHDEIRGRLSDIIARLPPDAVVVPRKPTKTMCHAGAEASQAPTIPVEVWYAMLQAAEENSDDRG